MPQTRVRDQQAAAGQPEDLLIFRARMRDCGVRVRLPNASPTFRLPDLIEITGEETLAAAILRLRSPAE